MSLNPSPVPLEDKQRRKQNLWKLFSPLCDRDVELESFVEFLVWLSLEFCRDVIFLCERPCELIGRIDGRNQKYTPDLFVRWKDQYEHLGETKKFEDLDDNELPVRWPVMSALAETQCMPLQLYHDGQFLEQRIAVGNWREALPYVVSEAKRPRVDLQREVIRHFETLPQLSLGELAASLPDWEESECHSVALWWVHQGRLKLDWNREKLGRNTVLTLTEDDDWRRQ